MNIIFLTIGNVENVYESGIYTDFIRELLNTGNKVAVVKPLERRDFKNRKNTIESYDNLTLLRVKMLNITKCSRIEKGLATIMLEWLFIWNIKKYLSGYAWDVVIYSTPPITLWRAVKYIKERYKAKAYLLLKDIFPQNAVDLGIIRKGSLVHRYFRRAEIRLYGVADRIGCMSQANVDYVRQNNITVPKDKLEIFPNCIEIDIKEQRDNTWSRADFNIQENAVVFVYGGNFGKPQDVDFIVNLMRMQQNKPNRYFIFCGSGTDYYKIRDFVNDNKPSNMHVIGRIEKQEYLRLLSLCDVGMIFLDKRFTIPNFPSRLLDYLKMELAVVAFTDSSTDIKTEILKGGFGWWQGSESADKCSELIDTICANKNEIALRGLKGKNYLISNYDVRKHVVKIRDLFMSQKEIV